MDSQTLWALVGILLGVVFSLLGVIYWLLREEDRRLSKNIHSLRTMVQTIVICLASHGIVIKTHDD